MQAVNCTWKGTTPIILHSCRCVNPLHPLTIAMKPLTSKHKKTEDDYRVISDIEWLQGAYIGNEDTNRKVTDYLTDNMYLYIPAENIEATLKNAGKAYKLGEAIKKFVQVPSTEIMLNTFEDKLVKEYWKNNRYRHVCTMVVNRSRIPRTRPRFDRWQIEFDLLFDESKIDLQQIITVMEYAGKYVGLCDSRPKYGKFVTILKDA